MMVHICIENIARRDVNALHVHRADDSCEVVGVHALKDKDAEVFVRAEVPSVPWGNVGAVIEALSIRVLGGDDLELWFALEWPEARGAVHRVVEPDENIVGPCAWELSTIANDSPLFRWSVEIGDCIIVDILFD
jgi:hypothetical protein